MLGAIIGDVAGSFREFRKTNKNPELGLLPNHKDIPEHEGLLGTVINYGMTDDSLLSLATARACMQLKFSPIDGFRPEDYFNKYYKEFADRYKDPIGGFGAGFRAWASDKNAGPYNSCGNGSAMRVSPVAYFATSLDEALELAYYSAIPTHNHPEGIKGAQATALMIYLARTGWNLKSIIGNLKSNWLYYEPIEQYYHFDAVCPETMRLVMHCLMTTNNFHDAVFKAVTIPYADSDTVGAIVGSIAEALYGIPDDLKQKGESFIIYDELKYVYKAFTDYKSTLLNGGK
jgi:ADP-ribosylglycohydrolase